jgi:DNA-binding transcriptional MocR family regulator
MRISDDRLVSLLGAWDEGAGPRWHRLAGRIAGLATKGVLEDGLLLPTERALSRRLGVSRATVAAAYDELAGRGLLESRQGSGSRIRRPAGAPPGPRGTSAIFTTLGAAPDGMIDLSLAESRSAEITRALIAELDPRWLTAHIQGTGYLPQGLPELREAMAGWLRDRGHPARADEMVITVGAQQAINLALQVLCPPGSTLLVEEATYPGVLEVARRLGLRPISVPGDEHGLDVDALRSLVHRFRPALLYVIPVANNPTGHVWSPARLDEVAAIAARAGLPVLDDRTSEPLAPPVLRVPGLATRLPAELVVTVASLSKIAWAGIRVGWLISSPGLTREVIATRIAADLAPPLTSQALVLHLVPELERIAEAVRADEAISIAATIDAISDLLPSWRTEGHRAGSWVWARLPEPIADRLADAAERQGVIVTPGPVFSAEARLQDRVRLAAVDPPDVLREAVRRLARAWEVVHAGRSDRVHRSPLVV